MIIELCILTPNLNNGYGTVWPRGSGTTQSGVYENWHCFCDIYVVVLLLCTDGMDKWGESLWKFLSKIYKCTCVLHLRYLHDIKMHS